MSMERRYGSDVMVDAMQAHNLKYVALNPGSSYRGLHDSIVNYGGNSPEIIEVPHEKVAVGLAHGYAKATGEPMGVILHNVVGLLHGTMGIYYAYVDRAPVVIFGGTGPMAIERRRPYIDWIHTANVQGNAVRDYTKWDDQPASIGAVPETVARGYRIAMSEPQGPVYIVFDAGMQEDELTTDVPPVDPDKYKVPTRMGADPQALDQLARLLVEAERPIIIPGYAGRNPDAFHQLSDLAELLGAGVIDTNMRLNFPNRHPLNVTGSSALSDADLVFFVDVRDMGKPTQGVDEMSRDITSNIPEGAKVVDLGFNDIGISSWSHDFSALHPTDLQVTADTTVALPLLIERCRELEGEDKDRHWGRDARRRALSTLHEKTWAGWRAKEEEQRDMSPVATSQLAASVWEVIKDYDWVLTAGTANDWALRTWDFDEPYRHAGASLGTATQISISLGVALAHKGTARLVVDLQPDGDLMFDPGALWVAAYYEIPILVVMFNNRAYNNDWDHQEVIAEYRGTPVENAYIGMEIDGPAPDFANIARSFGWYAEGPIDDPSEVSAAVARAAEIVQSTGQPALVDVVCQRR
jgi:acetolactate synthase I/II/III large subunit